MFCPFPALEALLFVPPDTEGSDGVSGLAVDRSLTAQLLEHLGRSGQTITRLADGDVEDQLLDAELPHGVGGFGVGLQACQRCMATMMAGKCVPL